MTVVDRPIVLSTAIRTHPLLLPVVLAGVFMAVLDFFIVNVAIPSFQTGLAAGPAAVQWVVAGFGLAYGTGMITGGRLGDLYGRRRAFVTGMAAFTLASAACGLAPTAGFLIGARIVQGLAAAAMAPQVLAILGTAYQGTAKVRAFTAYGLTLGLAAVFGQLIGGVLIHADLFGLGWRGCFLINLPVGAVALVLAFRVVPESRGAAGSRPDLVGMLLVTAALVATVLPLIEGRDQGWPAWTWLCLAAAVPLLAAFAAHQRWRAARGRSALVDLTLFRERAFTAGLLTQLAVNLGLASLFLILALYLQDGLGLGALGAGLAFVPMGAGYLATSLLAARVARRLGRQVLAVGALVMVVGLILLRQAALGPGTVGWLIPGLVVDGAGMGLVIAPLASTVLARVRPHHAGAAAGVLTTTVQIGNALGVALIGIVFYGALHGGYPHAFSHGLIYLAAVELAVAALVQFLPTLRHDRQP
jgi:EmrB/QacA subfamily drug resistance transporter